MRRWAGASLSHPTDAVVGGTEPCLEGYLGWRHAAEECFDGGGGHFEAGGGVVTEPEVELLAAGEGDALAGQGGGLAGFAFRGELSRLIREGIGLRLLHELPALEVGHGHGANARFVHGVIARLRDVSFKVDERSFPSSSQSPPFPGQMAGCPKSVGILPLNKGGGSRS